MDARRLRSIAMIAIFDIGGPLLAYNLLRAHGFSPVAALVLSGVLPAVGVVSGIVRRRRADAVGILVLAGIVVGAILGLVSRNPKLVLDEGSVGTAVFGLLCLGSLATARPLMYRMALEFIGHDSPQGREFTGLWQYDEFRHVFRVITIVWGVAYLAEAAARVVIVQCTPAGTALAVSKFLPYAVAALLVAWNIGYGRQQKRKGEALAAEYANASEGEHPMTSSEHAGQRILGTLGSADGVGVVRVQDRVDASIDAVWSALTDPVRLGHWLGEVQGDLRLGGEYQARFFSSGWEGTGRVEACEQPRHLLVRTRQSGKTVDQFIEATLTADGGQTVLVWEERGMPVAYVSAYGAGIQVHVEDLGAYLAGRGRCDADARWAQLHPAYQELAADVG